MAALTATLKRNADYIKAAFNTDSIVGACVRPASCVFFACVRRAWWSNWDLSVTGTIHPSIHHHYHHDPTERVEGSKTFSLPGDRKLSLTPAYDHNTKAFELEVAQVR